jgi:hydroxymethylglutaryl-CoA reductase (NADPH)
MEVLKKSQYIPRKAGRNYEKKFVLERLKWLSVQTNTQFSHINYFSINPEETKQNIENLIGISQIPVGIAGPLKVNGKFANGVFYVPFATTEGVLVSSYEFGMVVITRSGGANVIIHKDEIHTSPVFIFQNINECTNFSNWIENNFSKIKKEAEKTTRHGKLLRIKPYIIGNRAILNFSYFTGDATGMNMINVATDAACKYISEETKAEDYYLRSNLSSDKKASFFNLIEGYGKEVSADVMIPRKIVRRYLNTTPEKMYDFWASSIIGSLQSGMIGLNAHYANGLAAVFIACGQDVAQVVNSSMGIAGGEVTEDGDLYVSVKIPCLVVGTVGGGTHLGTQRECLNIMDCYGPGKAKKFAEIIAATILAGEISICAALSSDKFISAHIAARSR